MANEYLSADRRPALLLVFGLCHTLLLTDAASVYRSSDGGCPLYDYSSGFSLTKVNNNGYKLDDAFCQGLPQPHAGQPTQCLLEARTVYWNTENWNQCDPGFYVQWNYLQGMVCCKPSSHPYTWNHCFDVPVQPNSYEVFCPAGFIVARTKDRQCGRSVCTSAITCCAIPDVPGPVKNLDEVKARVMDDTQVPLSLLAHFLGFGYCGGCGGYYIGDWMKKSGDKWISSTTGSCSDFKKNERLSITYSDFKLVQSKLILSEVTYSDLKPVLLSTDYFVNNDTQTKTVTVSQEIYREHTISHTKLTSFTLSQGCEFQVSYKSSFLGGVETNYNFGYETVEENITWPENSDSYTGWLTLPPCTAAEYKIFFAAKKATQYYNATIDVLYSATLESFLRYGGGRNGRYTNFHNKYRGSAKRPSLSYKFGSSRLSLHDDLKFQSSFNSGPWEWKNMKDRYQYAGILLDILTDYSRHRFDLEGRFDELIGNSAYISVRELTPPAGCKVPERNRRSVSNNERLSTPTNAQTTSDPEAYTSAEPVDLSRSTTTPVSAFSHTTDDLDSRVTKARPDPQKTTATQTAQEATSTPKENTSTFEDNNSFSGKITSTLKETTSDPTDTNATSVETSSTPEETTAALTTEETTKPPVIDFQETSVRYVDLETGSSSDIADVDTDEIIGSGDYPEKDQEEILYFLPNGDRNPNFDFAKFFVALGDDNRLFDESP